MAPVSTCRRCGRTGVLCRAPGGGVSTGTLLRQVENDAVSANQEPIKFGNEYSRSRETGKGIMRNSVSDP
jgi:hypothetical protein